MTQAANSALHSARLRFVEGLPARADELSSTAERLARDPGDQEAAAMLRRRLHALLASAQVFEERALSLAVQDLIARLDVAQRAERPFTREEIDAVTVVVASLPTYVRPSLQPPAAYSDVRELLGGEDERPTARPAAVSGATWSEPDRSQAASAEPLVEQVSGPVVIADLDLDSDEYVPAALADSTPPVANDLDPDFFSEAASELENVFSERPLPPRARRIIALSALQPGPGGWDSGAEPDASGAGTIAEDSIRRPAEPATTGGTSASSVLGSTWTIVQPALAPTPASNDVAAVRIEADVRETSVEAEVDANAEGPAVESTFELAGLSVDDRPTVEALAPILFRETDVPSVRPLPAARDSYPGGVARAAATLFADERSELQAVAEVEAVSEIMKVFATPSAQPTTASHESWSNAVAEAGEELAAWRDSLLPPDALPEIVIEDESAARTGAASGSAAAVLEDSEEDRVTIVPVAESIHARTTVDTTDTSPRDASGPAARESEHGVLSALRRVTRAFANVVGGTHAEARESVEVADARDVGIRESVDVLEANRESVDVSEASQVSGTGVRESVADASEVGVRESVDVVEEASQTGSAEADSLPLTAASPEQSENTDAVRAHSAANAVTKLRRPAKYVARGPASESSEVAGPTHDAQPPADPRGAITKLRRPSKPIGRPDSADLSPASASHSHELRSGQPEMAPAQSVRRAQSTDDVFADAGRAGFGGGAAALETLDLDSASDARAVDPVAPNVIETSSAPEWLEPNRLESTGVSSLAPESAEFGSFERNSISADDAFDDDPITLDMRPPEIAEWADSRTEIHERSQSVPRIQSTREETAAAQADDARAADDALEAESQTFPIAPASVISSTSDAGATAAPTPDIEVEVSDPDRDSSATVLISGDLLDVTAASPPTAAAALDQDADADSSATAAPFTIAELTTSADASAGLLAGRSSDASLAIPAVDRSGDFVESDFSDQTSPGLGPPVLLSQTVSGLLPVPRPALLLLVADASSAARATANLTSDAYVVLHASSADEAVKHLHDAKPDLVLVSADLASLPEVDLVRRLKTDPLTPVEQVHVLLPEGATFDQSFLEQISADGAVGEPLTNAALDPLLRKSASSAAQERSAREGSIDEIAAQIAEEIRRGIAESLRAGKHDHTRPGDGSQLMAAAWSAIGRVRSHLADQSRGQAKQDGEGQPSASLLPATETSEASRSASIHPSQLLAGHRVLVADDDPAVLWFFVGLLREASAHVLQAHNGREALELARRKQPHVIVSDILMPKLDGFGLCRELKRDALLSHVPVILLSWKDDLLQRMRELDAGAAGYLRKEAGSQQILAQLTDVLQPRTRLVAKLRGHAEVSGSLAELGAFSMLELVAAERPDARISVRDALNLFEVDIRSGRRLSVTRTAADGAFTRGEKALMQLLGLAGAEFHVSSSTAQVKTGIPDPLDRALAAAGRRLSAIVDAVSDARLLRVCLIAFDDDVLQSLLSAPSTRLHEVVALFRTGNATAEGVLREGRFAPGELEDYLRELARCVAITGVWDSNGEDLVAAAQRERETPQLALLSSTLPPRTGSGSWSLAPEKRSSVRPRSESPVLEPAPQAAAPAEDDAAPPARRSSVPPAIIASSSVAFTTIDSDADPKAAEQLIATAASHTPSDSDTVPEASPPSAAQEKIQTQPGIGPESRPPEVPDWLKPQALIANTSIARSSASPLITPPPHSALAASGVTLSTAPTAPPVSDEVETDAVSKAELDSFDLPIPSMFARGLPDRSEGLRLAGTLTVLAAVGYFGWQQFILTPEQAQPAQTRVEAAKKPPETIPTKPQAQAPAKTPEPSAAPLPAQPTIQNTQFGKVLPFVDASRGVAVAPDQGLLVIEFQAGADPAPYVRVGSRELGKPPLAVALPAGRHELVVRTGKSTSFRYLIVRAGETRIVSVPLAEL
ncbi:MAG TPA: response regulator [Polyangiales bacterium]|nr:response regulator [Polyangiales bacterium]